MSDLSEGVKVLVEWINDDKMGIENITSVPEESRHVGMIPQVLWTAGGANKSRGNKRYPAKILMISDDLAALEKEEERLLEAKKKVQAAGKRKRGSARHDDGKATEQDVVKAVGERKTVPQPLQPKTAALNKAKRQRTVAAREAETALDLDLVEKAKKTLPYKELSSEEYQELSENETLDYDDVNYVIDKTALKGLKMCSCQVCMVLKKSDMEAVSVFLRSMLTLFSQTEASIQYLEPLEVLSQDKVELTKGKGLFISAGDKNQIKVDFADKPNQMVKETLFTIFGKEAFKKYVVTARGNRPGTRGIPSDVMGAVLGFVNRNVSKERRMSQTDLVSFINKRAIDWRMDPRRSSSKKLEFSPSFSALPEHSTLAPIDEKTSSSEELMPQERTKPAASARPALSTITSGALTRDSKTSSSGEEEVFVEGLPPMAKPSTEVVPVASPRPYPASPRKQTVSAGPSGYPGFTYLNNQQSPSKISTYQAQHAMYPPPPPQYYHQYPGPPYYPAGAYPQGQHFPPPPSNHNPNAYQYPVPPAENCWPSA